MRCPFIYRKSTLLIFKYCKVWDLLLIYLQVQDTVFLTCGFAVITLVSQKTFRLRGSELNKSTTLKTMHCVTKYGAISNVPLALFAWSQFSWNPLLIAHSRSTVGVIVFGIAKKKQITAISQNHFYDYVDFPRQVRLTSALSHSGLS